MKTRLNSLSILMAAMLCIICSACSDKTFDPQLTRDLIGVYKTGETLSFDQLHDLMEQEQFAVNDIIETINALLTKKSDREFEQDYRKLADSPDFVEKVDLCDETWRILTLSQPRFSERNILEYSSIREKIMIIDTLFDDLTERLAKISPDTAP